MPQQKFKSENYTNFGGINQKISPHDTSQFEFLDLSNLDFQTPGSLSQRWGSTQYIGQTFPGQINSLFEFARLDGSSYVVQSYSGGVFYGATTGQTQGMSFTLQSQTLSLFSYVSGGLAHGNALSSFAPTEIDPSGLNWAYQGDVTEFAGSSRIFINPLTQSDNRLSYAVLNNFMFAADGNKFFKFDGITTTAVGLPPVLRSLGVTTTGASIYYSALSGASDFIGLGITSGTYHVYMSYVNNRGFEGPLWPVTVIGGTFVDGSTVASLGGGTYVAFRMNMATPLDLGISAINQYIYFNATFTPTTSILNPQFWGGYGGQMRLVSQTPASGSTVTYVPIGSTINGQTLIWNNLGGLPPTNSYQNPGITLINNGPYTTTSEIDLINFAPRFLETYQNRLFLAGFSTTPSTVWFSDVAEPEGYAPDFNFEVRTNDGDFITCIKAYSTEFYILKKRSFHILDGDNPTNFSVRQISDQYGCINNRCCVLFNDQMMFLDTKGLILWNGAGINPISDQKIKPIFDRMNQTAALTEACMVHDKVRNQILISIPVDGSTTNNLMVVYDYLVGAWTTYKNFSASSLAQVFGRNSTRNAFYGDYQGRVNQFGASFLNDNGATVVPYWKTRFIHDFGDSTSKTYRRLFLDTDAPGASTNAFKIDFYQNYGPSIVLSTTLTLTQTQRRIDFGIQNSKSVAFELTGLQMALPLRIHGFTLESRMSRRV